MRSTCATHSAHERPPVSSHTALNHSHVLCGIAYLAAQRLVLICRLVCGHSTRHKRMDRASSHQIGDELSGSVTSQLRHTSRTSEVIATASTRWSQTESADGQSVYRKRTVSRSLIPAGESSPGHGTRERPNLSCSCISANARETFFPGHWNRWTLADI
jgi:hypothetical protein